MTTGGQFYRKRYKPAAIQYMEENFQQFFKFMEVMSPEYVEYVKNITENYVTYVTNMSPKVATYLEQTVPLRMNCEQTLTTVAADKNFITPDGANGALVGLVDADFDNLVKAFLMIIGRAVNTFDGQNNLDCTAGTENHWYTYIGGPGGTLWHALENDLKADGVMADTDWECMAQGVVHPFTFMFDITNQLNSLANLVGVVLARGRSRQNNLIVTIDAYMKLVWKL